MPTRVFVYPGGGRMCLDGLVRAAYTGNQLLNSKMHINDIENMVRKGGKAIACGASTHKRNLIYAVVYHYYKYNYLTDFVNTDGDFMLNNLTLSNVFSDKHRVILNNLLTTGILRD